MNSEETVGTDEGLVDLLSVLYWRNGLKTRTMGKKFHRVDGNTFFDIGVLTRVRLVCA